MTERIAIIGWGSLLWDLDNLAPHVSGEWELDLGRGCRWNSSASRPSVSMLSRWWSTATTELPAPPASASAGNRT